MKAFAHLCGIFACEMKSRFTTGKSNRRGISDLITQIQANSGPIPYIYITTNRSCSIFLQQGEPI